MPGPRASAQPGPLRGALSVLLVSAISLFGFSTLGTLLLGAASVLLLWWSKPWLCGHSPRPTSFISLHILVCLGLLAFALKLFHWLALGTSYVWSNQDP